MSNNWKSYKVDKTMTLRHYTLDNTERQASVREGEKIEFLDYYIGKRHQITANQSQSLQKAALVCSGKPKQLQFLKCTFSEGRGTLTAWKI